jgi:hypothetical protein
MLCCVSMPAAIVVSFPAAEVAQASFSATT